MENLIVVRHGNYENETGGLTDFGKKQIEKLARFIKRELKGDYYFASSGALRARQSATRLISNLGISFSVEMWPELFDEEDYLTLDKAEKIHKKVNKWRDKRDNLVLVSHFSVATGYPTYFMQKEFGGIRGIDNVPKGKAVLVDIVSKDYDIIPH